MHRRVFPQTNGRWQSDVSFACSSLGYRLNRASLVKDKRMAFLKCLVREQRHRPANAIFTAAYAPKPGR